VSFKQVRSWLLASAITVFVAVALLTVAVPTPAEAGGPYCLVYDSDTGCLSIGPGYNMPCHLARAACREHPTYEAYSTELRRGTHKLICGDGQCRYKLP